MRYHTGKLYLVRLAQVTEIKESWFETGQTFYKEIKCRYFVAKKIKHGWYSDPDMKLILSKIEFYSESKRTRRAGDFFALEIIPLLSFDNNKQYITKKEINQLEKLLANQALKQLEEFNNEINKEKNNV